MANDDPFATSARGGVNTPALTTFANMQTAGQARPTPQGYSNGPSFLQAIPVSGDHAPPPPSYVTMSANQPGWTLPPPADKDPTPSNPTAQQPGQSTAHPTSQPQEANPQGQPEDSGGGPSSYEDWQSYSPLSGMTEQQKAQYWAGKGVTGLAYGAQQTGYKGDPNAGGAVAKYDPQQVASNDAALAAAGKNDPTVQSVQQRQAAALASTNVGINKVNDQNTQASWAAYANSVPGKTTGLDPNGPPPSWFTGTAYTVGGPVATPSMSTGTSTRTMLPTDRSTPGMTSPTYKVPAPPGIVTRPGLTPRDRPGGTGGNGIDPNGVDPYNPNTPSTNPNNPGSTPGTRPNTLPPNTPPPAQNGPFSGPTGGLSKILMDRLTGFQPYTSGVDSQEQALVQKMLTQPSPYDSQMFQDNYNMLSSQINDQYAQQAKGVNETGAKRGLYDSSRVVGQLGDLGIQHDRANHDLALQLLTQRAQGLTTDQNNAVNAANSYAGQGLNAFNSNENAYAGRINQATNYDQDLFNRSLQTAQQNETQQNDQNNFWLKMMGY